MTRPLSTAPKAGVIRVVLSTGITTVAEWAGNGWSVSVAADDDRAFDIVGWVE